MEQKNESTVTALLVMDVQGATVKLLQDNTDKLITPLTQAIAKARENNIPVIYVVVGFRKGYPEVSSNNKSFSSLKKNPSMGLDTEDGTKIFDEVAPQEGDIVVTKKRVSAFAGSDLEVILRGLNVRHIALTGISTSGVILSTLREAADKDFAITVLTDCCADLDEEVHRVLTTKVFPRQATVITAEEWL
jgi:nicotinamidase-related amidase